MDKGKKTNTRAQDIIQEKNDVIGGDSQLRSLLAKEYTTAQDAIRYFSLDWDEFEELLFIYGRNRDNTRQRLSDGSLSAIVIERAGRVMSQMPTGTVNALGLQNQGKGLLMDLILEKYIFPNANEQYPLQTKLMLWDAYSNVYGTMAMCYDWTVEENYVGPTCWLVPMRNFFPQQGRLSVRDSDFVFISTFQPRLHLQDIVDDKVENYDLEAIQEILDETKEGGTKPKARDDYLRTNPMFEYRRRAPLTDTGDIEVVTKYEKGKNGHWIDFCPDFGNRVIRNIKNPHNNGKIPVVLKYGFPTLDSIIGLGDMERGRYMQYAIDTVDNLMIDGLKLRTYPPVKVVNGNVVMPTIRFQPGAKWLVSNPNDVSHHQFPDVDNNNNALLSMLKGALSNVTGTSNVQSSAESSSAAQGKTPTAIKKAGASESTRDSMDAQLMDLAIQELIGNMIDLINSVSFSKPIELYAFGAELTQIAQSYPDVMDAVKVSKDGQTAKITIKPSRIKNEKGYSYKIDPMSTRELDDEKTHEQLTELLTQVLDNPEAAQILQALYAQSGQTIDVAGIFTEWMKTGGVRNWKTFVKPLAQSTPAGQMGSGAPASMPGQQQQGTQQSTPAEAINIKDLPPNGQVQMAKQAGIILTPQDFQQQAEDKEALKTKGQIAVKTATPQVQQDPNALNGATQTQTPQIPPVASQAPPGSAGTPMMNDPDIAQARAQIMAHHEAFRSNVQRKVMEQNGQPK